MPRFITRKRAYNLKGIHDRHREIIRMLAIGMSRNDIAATLHIDPMSVTNVSGSEITRARIDELQDVRDDVARDVAARIQEVKGDALELLVQAIDGKVSIPVVGPNEAPVGVNQRIRVAQDLLGRAGHVAPTKSEVNVTHGHFTASDIIRLKELQKEAVQPAVYNIQSEEKDATL